MLSPSSPRVDPCLCPLCGKSNQCAMEAAKASGETTKDCWCVKARFSPELLARVPIDAQRNACICQACAQPT